MRPGHTWSVHQCGGVRGLDQGQLRAMKQSRGSCTHITMILVIYHIRKYSSFQYRQLLA